MKANRAFFSGLLAGVAITVLLAFARWLGFGQLNLEMLLGTFGTLPGLNAWILGFHLHLLFAGIFGLFYGLLFEAFDRSGPAAGLVLGLAHAFVVGILLGVLSAFHPVMGDELPGPGWFAASYGFDDVILLFAVHAVFGAIVGELYEEPLRSGHGNYVET